MESDSPYRRHQPLSTDVINMARIRVAGVGGLGLVAVAVVVALFVPTIRQSVTAGLVLGALLGITLILLRRQAGPLPSSGRRPGANIMLAIDNPVRSPDVENDDSLKLRSLCVSVVPAGPSHPG